MLVDVCGRRKIDTIAGKEVWRLDLWCEHWAVAILGVPRLGEIPTKWDCVACDEERKTKEVADGR